jgi:hypothetical protein
MSPNHQCYLSPNLSLAQPFTYTFTEPFIKSVSNWHFILFLAQFSTRYYLIFKCYHPIFKPISNIYIDHFQAWHPTSHSLSHQTSHSPKQSTFHPRTHFTSNLSRLDPFGHSWPHLTPSWPPVDPQWTPSWPLFGPSWPHNPNWPKITFPNCPYSCRAYLSKILHKNGHTDRTPSWAIFHS